MEDARNIQAAHIVRKKVLVRDNYKCQFPGCKYRGKKLEVHHIITFAYSVALRYVEKNLITLCKKCHHKVKNKETLYASMFNTIINNKYK